MLPNHRWTKSKNWRWLPKRNETKALCYNQVPSKLANVNTIFYVILFKHTNWELISMLYHCEQLLTCLELARAISHSPTNVRNRQYALANALKCILQSVPYRRTFELWAFKDANVCLHVQSPSQFLYLAHAVVCMHPHKQVCSCGPHGAVLHRAQWGGVFSSSPGCLKASVKAAAAM